MTRLPLPVLGTHFSWDFFSLQSQINFSQLQNFPCAEQLFVFSANTTSTTCMRAWKLHRSWAVSSNLFIGSQCYTDSAHEIHKDHKLTRGLHFILHSDKSTPLGWSYWSTETSAYRVHKVHKNIQKLARTLTSCASLRSLQAWSYLVTSVSLHHNHISPILTLCTN